MKKIIVGVVNDSLDAFHSLTGLAIDLKIIKNLKAVLKFSIWP